MNTRQDGNVCPAAKRGLHASITLLLEKACIFLLFKQLFSSASVRHLEPRCFFFLLLLHHLIHFYCTFYGCSLSIKTLSGENLSKCHRSLKFIGN